MIDISWLDFIILIFSSFRLTHLIVFDEITSFIRDPFIEVAYEPDESGQVLRKIKLKGSGWQHWAGLFLSCHWCVGVWSAFGLVVLYIWLPVTLPLHLILAVAGAASFLESKLYFG